MLHSATGLRSVLFALSRALSGTEQRRRGGGVVFVEISLSGKSGNHTSSEFQSVEPSSEEIFES